MVEPYEAQIAALAEALRGHRLYGELRDARGVRTFMRYHVFAVWDFQSLLKALQRRLTGVDVPWIPSGDPQAARLINEVVLEEESDEHPDGGYSSHFELYLEAMHEAGADTGPIERLITELQAGRGYGQVLAQGIVPTGAARFLHTTFETIETDELHRIVALFTYTREDLIPGMFTALVESLAQRKPHSWDKFLWYLNRHIEIDGERHGPISHALLGRICGEDPRLWQQAGETALKGLRARQALWDEILRALEREAA
jgi:hypothetical protein